VPTSGPGRAEMSFVNREPQAGKERNRMLCADLLLAATLRLWDEQCVHLCEQRYRRLVDYRQRRSRVSTRDCLSCERSSNDVLRHHSR